MCNRKARDWYQNLYFKNITRIEHRTWGCVGGQPNQFKIMIIDSTIAFHTFDVFPPIQHDCSIPLPVFIAMFPIVTKNSSSVNCAAPRRIVVVVTYAYSIDLIIIELARTVQRPDEAKRL